LSILDDRTDMVKQPLRGLLPSTRPAIALALATMAAAVDAQTRFMILSLPN
jgi:hypothetical protein